MTRGFMWILVLVAPVALAECAGAQGPNADAGRSKEVMNEESLRDSFAERIQTTELVTDFVYGGDEFRFTGPDGEGGTIAWRVVIDSLLVEPRVFDEEQPYEGRVTSTWYANGEIVEYLGNMTALPEVYQDRGLAQDCWAYWMEDERNWDW